MVEKKKSNKGIIIILVLLVLALGGYIVYDKFFSEPKEGPTYESQLPSQKQTEPIEEDIPEVVEEPKEVEEEPTPVTTPSEVIDLGYFSSKNVNKITYVHACYLACDPEYEYNWVTTDTTDIINVFKTLKNNIVKKISIPKGLGGPGEEKSITFNYEDGTSYKVSLMNDFVMVFKNGKSIGAWKYSKKNFDDVQKVMKKATKTTVLEEVVDLGYFSSKNVNKITYSHDCYLACEPEFEYNWVTTDTTDIINVFKTLKNNIVKKTSVPTGLGGPGEERSITFNYEDGPSYKIYVFNDVVVIYKNGKSVGAWKYSKKNFDDVQKAMTKATKTTVLE